MFYQYYFISNLVINIISCITGSTTRTHRNRECMICATQVAFAFNTQIIEKIATIFLNEFFIQLIKTIVFFEI